MFVKLTPRHKNVGIIHVNMAQVKVMLEDDLDDALGTVLVFDVADVVTATEEGQVGIVVNESIEEIMELMYE